MGVNPRQQAMAAASGENYAVVLALIYIGDQLAQMLQPPVIINRIDGSVTPGDPSRDVPR